MDIYAGAVSAFTLLDMGKKKRGKKKSGGAATKSLWAAPPEPATESAEDQALIQELRRALRSDEPLDLLGLVSSLLAVTDPRSQNPFDEDGSRVGLTELIDSFIGTSYAETTAALAVMRQLLTDEAMKDRIGRELISRKHPMPYWLRTLEQVRVDPDVRVMTHVLGDGDDYLFAGALPSGESLTALVYVDHNMGTVVKDAFLVPATLDELAEKATSAMTDADQSIDAIDPATARAIIEQAIEDSARTYPPLESESWPQCRALVEWLLGHLPAGGSAPEPEEWSDQQLATLTEDFFSSPFGSPLDRPDERDLLETLMWFSTGYSPGGPLRWSQVKVEIVLADWFPRKVIADASVLVRSERKRLPARRAPAQGKRRQSLRPVRNDEPRPARPAHLQATRPDHRAERSLGGQGR